MNKTKSLLLFIIPLLTSCQSISSSNIQKNILLGSEPFLTYAAPEQPTVSIAKSIQVEFEYIDGCLLVFDPVSNNLITPVFPSGMATFDINNQTLRILNTDYNMKEVISARGYTKRTNYNELSTFKHVPPEKCIKENLAIFIADYEKTTWGE